MDFSAVPSVWNDDELLIGAFNITENLQEIRRHWHGQTPAAPLTSDVLGGLVFCLTAHCERPQLLATMAVRTPMGLYYSQHKRALFTASDHWIMELQRGRVSATLHNRFFNCLHGISPSLRGDAEAVFVASTGIDAILELDLDTPQSCLWDWFATEHGYDHSANGQPRSIPRGATHQGVEYSTPIHTTHVNSVLQLTGETILATLFHQGQLIAIDTVSKETTIVLDGLRKPHGLHRLRNGHVMVCDTDQHRVLILNSRFHVVREIAGDFAWVQDACELHDGTIVIADANNHRLVRLGHANECIWEWPYDTDKRIGCLLALDAEACRNIFRPMGLV